MEIENKDILHCSNDIKNKKDNVKKSEFEHLMKEGLELYNSGNFQEAVKIYKTAEIMEKDLDKQEKGTIYIRLANTYYKLDDIDKYTYYYEEYLKLYPQGQASVFSRLGHAYYFVDSDKSVFYHNKALEMEISEYDAACKIFSMIKSASYTQEEVFEESEYEAERVKNKFYRNIEKFNHEKKKENTDRKLKIGYLSSDCYTHTVMNYLLPVFENHDKEKFEIYIFNGTEKNDVTTDKLKSLCVEMIPCSKMNNFDLAKAIYEKNIDILVDLGGYTHLKSFCAFYKPAPIIISYMGYLNTLGIKEVDYIIADKYTIPEDKACFYTEKPLYLNSGYQVFNCSNLCDIEDNPFKKNGYITFGSFNCTSKINDTTVYMWSNILKKSENSRLMIYRTRLNKSIIKTLKSKFAKWGIGEDRVYYVNDKYSPHYRAYSMADIALDTYCFSGMSITIETALMGVPTVTLVGEGMQSRGAGRINEIIGNKEFNAYYGDEYVDIAVKLANNKNKLEKLRKELREKVNNSVLKTEPVTFTRELEEKYKQIFNDFVNK